MFKKSSESSQLNIFTSPTSLFSGNSLKMYDNENAWHNQFRQQVTMRIDEGIFRPLYCKDNGSPNAPIRVLVSMMVLKEAEGLSDQKIFENCRFNMLTRSAIGLFNVSDSLPTESTYYLFRKNIMEYAKKNGENLFETAFAQITKDQCSEFEVSGKRIRMDSKLMGSNIAWLSRYELIHETLRLFYNEVKKNKKIDEATDSQLSELLKLEGNKIVYTSSNEEIQNRLLELGTLIYKISPLFSSSKSARYQTLQRVFKEQYSVDENKLVVARKKEEISAKSVQSPHDTDCHYRKKDTQKVKGYSVNVTESCDDDKENKLNLIGHVDVRKASTSDVDFLKDCIDKAQDVFTDKIKDAHADGAYHSPDNQGYCEEKKIELYLHAIQGGKSRYEFILIDNVLHSILDTQTNEVIEHKAIISKDGENKWRIKTEKGYRYFTQKDIDSCLIRKKIAETPIETLQKRNNVEATIFQLGYHCSNAKTRYRGEIKHQMWANVRCLWVNFVRIQKFKEKLCKSTNLSGIFSVKSLFYTCQRSWLELKLAIKSIFREMSTKNLSISENINFSKF